MTAKLFRSVGATDTDLNTSARTVTITGSTAIFSEGMPNNVGIGDCLVYNDRLAFIHARINNKVYTVKDKDGIFPSSAAAGTAVGIFRCYTSLLTGQ